MSEFKVGDVVKCVQTSESPNFPQRVGELYTVQEVSDGDLRIDGQWVLGDRFAPLDLRPIEIRTTSSTGGQKGVKPQRYDLLPKAGLDAIAEVFAFGAEKYDSHNWRKGYEWSKSYSALMRHMTAHWEGETLDPESGLPHLAHAGCHIMFMLTWLKDQGEGSQFDDRFVKPE